MPHLILEASSNILETTATVKQCLIECQNLLTEKLPTQLSSCKSRYIKHEVYVVGDDSINNAFVHLGVKVLSGRSPQILMTIIEDLRKLLIKAFNQSAVTFKLSISVELTDLGKYYTKTTT